MTGSSPPAGTVAISADVVKVLLISGLMKRYKCVGAVNFGIYIAMLLN